MKGGIEGIKEEKKEGRNERRKERHFINVPLLPFHNLLAISQGRCICNKI